MKMKKTTSFIITVVLTIASLVPALFPHTVSAAIAINELTQGACTSDPCSTASISPTAGSVVYIAVAVATNSDGGTNPTDSITISGNGLTWTKVATVFYGSRRRLWVYRGTGTASAGAITMDYWGGSIYNETMWSVDEFTGVDSTTPNDAATTASILSTGTSLAVGDVGTPDTGDVIYGAFAMAVANDNLAPESGFTALTQIQNGANVRALLTEYDATATLDETPGSTWSTTLTTGNGAGGIGFIINGAAATTDQEGFRFRNDDGSETTATWLADQDTNITRDKDLTTRLRFLIDSSGDLPATQYQLEWRKMGDTASDDFDRPDNVSLGSNWTEAYSDQDILSNRLNLRTGGYVKNLAIFSGSATASTDQYVKAVVYSTASGGYPEMVFRYTNSSSAYYAIEFNVDGDTALWRRYPTAAGSSADISAATAITVTTGDVFGITVSGTGDSTVVRIWRNPTGNFPNSATDWGGDSSPDITFTDNPASPVNSGTYAGVGGYQSTVGTISFDNFFTGDVSGGASLSAPWRIATTTIGSDITIVGSANIGASGANTTAELAPPDGKATSDFVAGRIQDDENPTDSVNITTDDYTEFEWSIVATSTTVTGNVFQFRITNDGVPLSLYAKTPQWTIGTAPAPNPGDIISRYLIRWGAIKVNNGRVIIK